MYVCMYVCMYVYGRRKISFPPQVSLYFVTCQHAFLARGQVKESWSETYRPFLPPPKPLGKSAVSKSIKFGCLPSYLCFPTSLRPIPLPLAHYYYYGYYYYYYYSYSYVWYNYYYHYEVPPVARSAPPCSAAAVPTLASVLQH